MKKRVVRSLITILLTASAVLAQSSTWTEDYSTAAALAKKNGSFILLNFSGSDWCPWCKKLDAEVFSQSAFKTFAETNLSLMLVDSPAQKQLKQEIISQNRELIQKYGIQGFPTIVILSPDGEFVSKTGYRPGGAESYIEHLKQIIDNHKKS